MKSKLLILLSFFVFATTACTDSPSSPVAPKDSGTEPATTPVGTGGEEEPVTALALKYVGEGPTGRTCNFYVALSEEEDHSEDSGGAHNHDEHFLMKFDFTTFDGHKPHAAEGQFYQVDNGNFVDVDPEIPGAAINLIAANFVDPSIEKLESIQHMNELTEDNKIEQAFRVQYKAGVDFHEYEEALEAVFADPATFAAHKPVLDQVQSALLIMLHNGDHPHTANCKFSGPTGLGAAELVETEFDMEAHEH